MKHAFIFESKHFRKLILFKHLLTTFWITVFSYFHNLYICCVEVPLRYLSHFQPTFCIICISRRIIFVHIYIYIYIYMYLSLINVMKTYYIIHEKSFIRNIPR